MLGNLESTGMVPRPGREKARLGSVRNFVEPEDISPLRLRPSPVDTAAAGTQYEEGDTEVELQTKIREDFTMPLLGPYPHLRHYTKQVLRGHSQMTLQH